LSPIIDDVFNVGQVMQRNRWSIDTLDSILDMDIEPSATALIPMMCDTLSVEHR